MHKNVRLEAVYMPSEDVVAREIEGEIIIVPLASGIGDTDDELYSLNETGRAIWTLFDGQRTIKDVMERLIEVFDAPPKEIEKDVVAIVHELLSRRIIVELKRK
jgi:hypothetical protein